MIKKSVHEDELIYGMQRELQSYSKKQGMENLDKAGNYLQAALEIFEGAGLTKQADAVLQILAKIAQSADDQDARGKPRHPKNPTKVHDPHTSGLTPDKMVENYKRHGIPFNLSDDGKANDLLDADIGDVELEVTDKPVTHDFEEEID